MPRVLLLLGFAPALSGCVFIYFAMVATIPGPRTSIDILWSDDDAVCRAAVEGEPGGMAFVGLESEHYAKASNQSFEQRRSEVWPVPTDDPSFTLIDGAGRSVFDFDNDGVVDVVYKRDDAIFVAPATRAMRDAFESGTKPEATLAGLGFRVYRRAALIAAIPPPARSLTIQRVKDVTYFLVSVRDVPFDPDRPSAPRYDSLYNDQEPNRKEAGTSDLYLIGSDGPAQKVCSFLVQRAEYAIGGF